MERSENRLVPYALGTLEASEREALERELENDSELRREMDSVVRTLEQLAEARPPLQPTDQLRARLLQSLHQRGPFAGHVERVAQFLDLGAGRVRDIFESAVDGQVNAWESGPLAGVELMHFDGGARVAAADCGLVRIASGTTFPEHRHLGDEWAFVLQGGIRERGGREFGPGDISYREAGSRHSFTAVGDEPLIFVLVLHEGLEFTEAS